jgi:hypothetical protein
MLKLFLDDSGKLQTFKPSLPVDYKGFKIYLFENGFSIRKNERSISWAYTVREAKNIIDTIVFYQYAFNQNKGGAAA